MLPLLPLQSGTSNQLKFHFWCLNSILVDNILYQSNIPYQLHHWNPVIYFFCKISITLVKKNNQYSLTQSTYGKTSSRSVLLSFNLLTSIITSFQLRSTVSPSPESLLELRPSPFHCNVSKFYICCSPL